jgi:hypothetical protein
VRTRIFIGLVALSLVGFVCGNRKPVVMNALDYPIYVHTTWDDGTSHGGELPASGHRGKLEWMLIKDRY